MKGADVFVGVSVANCVTKEMVKSMAERPVIFAMANPVPEIPYADALEAGAFVAGTGRSDFPNQVNNVLGFPGIFRGALDTRAKQISEGMKLAASEALAVLANEKIPADVLEFLAKAYPSDAKAGVFESDNPLKRTHVIPKPLDPRVVPRVAAYVAAAAMRSGVAQVKIPDLKEYEAKVAERIREAI
jgi:malic enzyme